MPEMDGTRPRRCCWCQVAERMGLLAEIQRVAVLFVGLSFNGQGIQTPSAPSTSKGGNNPGRKVLNPSSLRTADSQPEPEATVSAASKSLMAGLYLSGSSRGGAAIARRSLEAQDSLEDREDDDEAARSALELLQGSFGLLQDIVAGHGGLIKELSVDDKGTVSGSPRMCTACLSSTPVPSCARPRGCVAPTVSLFH